MRTRKIIHIDMDCFYAAVEVRDRPELRGKPVAVGGSPDGRGVIATASYEAREFGVKSAMASSRAMRLCPELVIVRPDFSKYKAESRKVRAILEQFSSLIEPLSLDEAYLDVSDSTEFAGSATRIAEEIRRRIQSETGLTASAGVAPNKFLAKIAGEINKPNGIKVIRPSEIEAFVRTLPVSKIWGVGKVTSEKMRRRGIETCADLQKYSLSELTHMFGSWGAQLYDFARGIDHREVSDDGERKSLSVEETYREDLQSLAQAREKMPELYDDFDQRLQRAGCVEKIRAIVIKLKFSDFRNLTHERTFSGYPALGDFQKLLSEAYSKRSDPIRLLGIGVRLEGATRSRRSSTQLNLFDV